MDYISTPKDPNGSNCIFCRFPDMTNDLENLLLYRGERSYIVMNRYPYASGHLMVVPYRHTADICTLDKNESAEIFALIQKSVGVLNTNLNPQGYNIGLNMGTAAGAGIAQHLHFHVVPRWEGDTNFIGVIAETRVLPESLKDTYLKLLKSIKYYA